MGNSESRRIRDKIRTELGYTFYNTQVLKFCLTHDSLRTDYHRKLEFWGDTLIKFVLMEYLFHEEPFESEDATAAKLEQMNNGRVQRELAEKVELFKYYMQDHAVPMDQTPSPDMRFKYGDKHVEALVGGVYEDAEGRTYVHWGMKAATKCVLKLWGLLPPKPELRSTRGFSSSLAGVV